MKREDIETAIHNLATLLNAGGERKHVVNLATLENVGKGESVFQKFFENHSCVFESMSFAKAYPQPKLHLRETDAKRFYLVPDFLLERFNGLFEIVDLKTPEEQLIRDIPYREKFYSKIEEYLSQLDNYSEYFDDDQYRAQVREQLSLDVQKRPNCMLIVGRDAGLDKQQLHAMRMRRSARPEIWTFDDVLTHLRMHYVRNFNRGDGLPGVSLYGAFAIERGDTQLKRYIYDQGLTPSANRVSLFLTGDTLAFEVFDAGGDRYHIDALIPQSVLQREATLFVSAFFGAGKNETFLQLRYNNSIVAEQIIAKSVTLDASINQAVATIGQDIEESNVNGTAFWMYELCLYPCIHTAEGRMKLVTYFIDNIVNGRYKKGLEFRNGKCLKKSQGDRIKEGQDAIEHVSDLLP